MERSVEGLTAKVLNERLRKLTTYKILQRRAYPEIPPRVEYRFSSFGEKFIRILDELAALDREFRDETSSDSRNTNPVAVEWGGSKSLSFNHCSAVSSPTEMELLGKT